MAMENPVGFSVLLEGNVSPGAGAKIPYNAVVTNVGNAYSTQRDEFICPHQGLYVFYVAGYATQDTTCRFAITKNADEIGQAYINHPFRSTGTNMFVLELEEADLVSVIIVASGCRLYGNEKYNSFSGFRIN